MNSEQIESVGAINYWEHSPKFIGFVRQSYLNLIFQHFENNLLKVLIGQRRSGKSYLLKQTIVMLHKQGVPKQNILYLNFELHELEFIQQATSLVTVVEHYFEHLKPEGRVYLFFDEIQEVEQWEKVINSYLANERVDAEIIITGSNAHLLSAELSTYVTGRYIEIPIYPLSFMEYAHYNKLDINKSSLITYLEDSGIPELLHLPDNRLKQSYIMSLKDSILMNDVVKRFNVKNPKLLILILDFIIDNIGHLFSFNGMVKKLKSNGIAVNTVTLSNYIHYLEMTYLIHAVERYDVRGKKILEGERKYYLNDLGFQNYLKSTFDDGINRKLENYVYQLLSQNGYVVYVGTIYQFEIDFVAEKNKQKIYLQVTYLLHDQKVIEREYGNLEKIKDNWPKWVVSLDDVAFPPKNGIQHIPAWELPKILE